MTAQACIFLYLTHTGKAEREALKHTLAAAVRQQSQASCSSCCVCETAGEVWVSSSSAEDEAHTLRFTAFSSLDFLSKAIRLTKGGVSVTLPWCLIYKHVCTNTRRLLIYDLRAFSHTLVCFAAQFACGSCRAVLDPQRFLHFAALRLSEQHPDRWGGACIHSLVHLLLIASHPVVEQQLACIDVTPSPSQQDLCFISHTHIHTQVRPSTPAVCALCHSQPSARTRAGQP